MPTRAKKPVSKKPVKPSAARKSAKGTAKRAGSLALPPPPPPALDLDPPIIIQGGGSVTIYSPYPLEEQGGAPPYPYVYHISNVDIAEMKWQGKSNQSDKSKNGKDFRIELIRGATNARRARY
jgi:hypothetical protein